MSDYTGRAEELLRYLEQINPPLPDEYNSAYRNAVANYMHERNDHLKQLLELVADDDPGHPGNAGGWRTVSNDAVSRMETYFHDQLELVSRADGPNDLPALGGAAVRVVDEERQFFSRLADVNAALMRDRLVVNAKELREYSEQLGEIWKRIGSDVEGSNERQRESYKEIVEIAKEEAETLAKAHRTFREKAEKVGASIIFIGTKVIGPIDSILGLGLPDAITGAGDVGEYLAAYVDHLAETHRRLVARTQNYLSFLEEEKGGLLPVFRQCRQQVYSYWNEKGTKTSSVWPDQARSSLDDWKSRCATSAQRDDADRFSADVYSKIKDRWDSVKRVADEFEEKWRGIFYGQLAPQIEDKLTDAIQWRQNADNLVSAGMVEIGQTVLADCDRIYSANLDEPFKQLVSAVESLPEERKAEAREALEKLQENIGTQIGGIMAALHKQVADTLNWFQPDAIRKLLDRGELQKLLTD